MLGPWRDVAPRPGPPPAGPGMSWESPPAGPRPLVPRGSTCNQPVFRVLSGVHFSEQTREALLCMFFWAVPKKREWALFLIQAHGAHVGKTRHHPSHAFLFVCVFRIIVKQSRPYGPFPPGPQPAFCLWTSFGQRVSSTRNVRQCRAKENRPRRPNTTSLVSEPCQGAWVPPPGYR